MSVELRGHQEKSHCWVQGPPSVQSSPGVLTAQKSMLLPEAVGSTWCPAGKDIMGFCRASHRPWVGHVLLLLESLSSPHGTDPVGWPCTSLVNAQPRSGLCPASRLLQDRVSFWAHSRGSQHPGAGTLGTSGDPATRKGLGPPGSWLLLCCPVPGPLWLPSITSQPPQREGRQGNRD